jgi:hypothetical protein
MDKNGNLLWSKTIGGTGDDYLYSIKQTSDGGILQEAPLHPMGAVQMVLPGW